MVGPCEGLHSAVVRDSDGFPPPSYGSAYDILHGAYRIHVAHLGMAVKLCALVQGKILSLRPEIVYLSDPLHHTYEHITFVFVHGGGTGKLKEASFLDILLDLSPFVLIDKEGCCHGIGKISDGQTDDELLSVPYLPFLNGNDLASHRNPLADILDICDGYGLLHDVISVDHGRIIALFCIIRTYRAFLPEGIPG